MSASARRDLFARVRAARALGLPGGRAERFAARQRGQAPLSVPLALAANWPRWPGWDAPEQARLHCIVGLIMARDALADEIDGERLRALAAVVSEAAIDQILLLPRGGDLPLPDADALEVAGRATAIAALPPELADGGVTQWRDLADTIAIAERIAESSAA